MNLNIELKPEKGADFMKISMYSDADGNCQEISVYLIVICQNRKH